MKFFLTVILFGAHLIVSAQSKKSGTIKDCNPEGNCTFSNYRNDTLHGIYFVIDRLGDTVVYGNYISGKMSGKWSKFKSGKISEEINYNNGVVSGEKRNFYPNGQLSYIASFTDGKLNGKEILYYKNGLVEKESNFKDGHLNGTFMLYHDNGNPKIKGFYTKKEDSNNVISSDITGLWQFFFRNGMKMKEGFFSPKQKIKMDTLEVVNKYEATTILKSDTFYIKDGIWHYFDEDGKYDHSVLFENGLKYLTLDGIFDNIDDE